MQDERQCRNAVPEEMRRLKRSFKSSKDEYLMLRDEIIHSSNLENNTQISFMYLYHLLLFFPLLKRLLFI